MFYVYTMLYLYCTAPATRTTNMYCTLNTYVICDYGIPPPPLLYCTHHQRVLYSTVLPPPCPAAGPASLRPWQSSGSARPGGRSACVLRGPRGSRRNRPVKHRCVCVSVCVGGGPRGSRRNMPVWGCVWGGWGSGACVWEGAYACMCVCACAESGRHICSSGVSMLGMHRGC